jgi:hypothetical protein
VKMRKKRSFLVCLVLGAGSERDLISSLSQKETAAPEGAAVVDAYLCSGQFLIVIQTVWVLPSSRVAVSSQVPSLNADPLVLRLKCQSVPVRKTASRGCSSSRLQRQRSHGALTAPGRRRASVKPRAQLAYLARDWCTMKAVEITHRLHRAPSWSPGPSPNMK